MAGLAQTSGPAPRVSGQETRDPRSKTEVPGGADAAWAPLYRLGGLSAVVAGILVRRNLAAEIDLIAAEPIPQRVIDWYELLQRQRFLALAYLDLFDVVNYVLVALVLLALYGALRRTHRCRATVAATLGLLGIAAYLATNAALSMLALSDQYAAAATEAEQATLAAAGQATLALHRFGLSGAHPGSGGYVSLLLVAVAGLLISHAMLTSSAFGRAPALAGIAANGLDLAYCLTYALVPSARTELLPVLFLPAAGLGLVVWHITLGLRLLKLARTA